MIAPVITSFMNLFRVSNLPTVWSNVLAALLLSEAPFLLSSFLTLTLSLSLFYAAGMALNDICDAGVDAVQRPSRPIPAGKIRLKTAQTVVAALFISAFVILFTLPHGAAAISSAMLLMGIIVIYDLYHKGNPLSVLLMAGCRFMVYITAGFGVDGKIEGAVLTIGLIQSGYIVLLSVAARFENSMAQRFTFPLIPLMLAGICTVDGIYLSVALHSPVWLCAGAGGMIVTMVSQKYVRGD